MKTQTNIVETITIYTENAQPGDVFSLTDDLCRIRSLRGVHFARIERACETLAGTWGYSFDGVDLKKV